MIRSGGNQKLHRQLRRRGLAPSFAAILPKETPVWQASFWLKCGHRYIGGRWRASTEIDNEYWRIQRVSQGPAG
eukprot:10291384-Lingulodinium_polyedra.AAC.1